MSGITYFEYDPNAEYVCWDCLLPIPKKFRKDGTANWRRYCDTCRNKREKSYRQSERYKSILQNRERERYMKVKKARQDEQWKEKHRRYNIKQRSKEETREKEKEKAREYARKWRLKKTRERKIQNKAKRMAEKEEAAAEVQRQVNLLPTDTEARMAFYATRVSTLLEEDLLSQGKPCILNSYRGGTRRQI